MKIIQICLIYISLLPIRKSMAEMTPMEKLIDKIYNQDEYDQMIRPSNKLTGLTHIETELKFLQIDLVRLCIFL